MRKQISQLKSSNKSGYNGVHFDEVKGKFQAKIGYNGKRIHIGYYFTAEDAAKAYDQMAKKLHKKRAFLNFKGRK